MSTYAIGDVQGCYDSMQALLERIAFDVDVDRLWFTGDLVNRGPRSAEVLRWVFDHRQNSVVVLGNHDLHLLARAHGVAKPKKRDTLRDLLEDASLDKALEWLAHCPFVHKESIPTSDSTRNFVLVHAGLLPKWSVADALAWSALASRKLAGKKRLPFLRRLARCRDLTPGKHATSTRSAAWAAQHLTNLRACDKDGRAALRFNRAPADLPSGLRPWHSFDRRRSDDHVYVCGHWAAQGLKIEPHLIALDSGCVWGNQLSAVRLEDGQLFQVESVDQSPDPRI